MPVDGGAVAGAEIGNDSTTELEMPSRHGRVGETEIDALGPADGEPFVGIDLDPSPDSAGDGDDPGR